MNIALGAVFLFILLLPPIAFYISYSSGPFAKAGPKFSLLDGLLASAALSLMVHALASLLIRPDIRFDLLLKLMGGELKDVEQKINNRTFETGLRQLAWYNVVILTLATALGRLTRILVKYLDIHHQYGLLRLYNRWWYLFNGYYLPAIGTGNRTYDLLFVDAVVDTRDSTLIYSGYLVDFICNGEELDRIYLSGTLRRELKKKTVVEGGAEVMVTEPGLPVEIPGAFFSLAYKEIKNLNLRFISLENSLEDIQEMGSGSADPELSV